MNGPLAQHRTAGGIDIVGKTGGLATMINPNGSGKFDQMSDEAKLDISLQLIGLSDDELASGGLTRDGILGFVFGEKAFTASA